MSGMTLFHQTVCVCLCVAVCENSHHFTQGQVSLYQEREGRRGAEIWKETLSDMI